MGLLSLKIIDVNGKEREAISIKRTTHQILDAVNGGIATTKEYVEVVIQGKTGRTWVEWYPFEHFAVMNPNLVIEDGNTV